MEEAHEEEVGLLAPQTFGQSFDGHTHSTKRKLHSSCECARDGGDDGSIARLLAAWRRPLGPEMAAPAWLQGSVVFTEEEAECVLQLRHLAGGAFDREDPTHERALRRFFAAVRSPSEARQVFESGVKDPRWKELGFQGDDPRTDIRGGGILAVQNMCYLAEVYPEETKRMLEEASSGSGEYLFAAACVNVSAMLVLLLGLNTSPGQSPAKSMPAPVNAMARKNFARILFMEGAREGGPEGVLGELFSSSVIKLHAEWVDLCGKKPGANMLHFGEALSTTAVALERLLGMLGSAGQTSLFSSLARIDSSHWTTRCWNLLLRLRSAAVEFACRLTSVLAELFGVGRKRHRRDDL